MSGPGVPPVSSERMVSMIGVMGGARQSPQPRPHGVRRDERGADEDQEQQDVAEGASAFGGFRQQSEEHGQPGGSEGEEDQQAAERSQAPMSATGRNPTRNATTSTKKQEKRLDSVDDRACPLKTDEGVTGMRVEPMVS